MIFKPPTPMPMLTLGTHHNHKDTEQLQLPIV
jgi:hypothetical protein